jgi:hypothetical protein
MTTAEKTKTSKTWQTTIEYNDGPATETVPGPESPWDTLRETTTAAITEAAEYLRAGLATEARIHLYKTTKARGTEYDRQGVYLWTEDGRVYVDRAR